MRFLKGDCRWKIWLNTDAIFSTQTAGAVQPKPSSASAIGRRLILPVPCCATDPIITESNSGRARAVCIMKFAYRFRHSSSGLYRRRDSELFDWRGTNLVLLFRCQIEHQSPQFIVPGFLRRNL